MIILIILFKLNKKILKLIIKMLKVVVIDFGSSGSRYAYSFYNKNDINHGNIFGQMLIIKFQLNLY